MKIRTDNEIQEKINDCMLNKSKYVEWLCQNKTEKQMEKLLHNLEKMYKFAVQKKTTNHIQLINLWKDQVNTALKNYSNYKHLYTIIKKFNKNKKITSFERMIVNNNHDWFYNRIYDLAEEEIKIVEG